MLVKLEPTCLVDCSLFFNVFSRMDLNDLLGLNVFLNDDLDLRLEWNFWLDLSLNLWLDL